MKLIVGIGNPGAEYTNTRHNIGFQILDKFVQKQSLIFKPAKSNFWYVESKLLTFPFFLVKPTTYVNNSGLVVKELIEHFNIQLSNTLVIYDDTNLSTGKIRIRKSGSDGGHNGIKSIIYHLESDLFPRIKLGVSSPNTNSDLAQYVLSEFTKEETEIFNSKSSFINDLIEEFIIGGSNNMLDFFSKNINT